VGTGAVLEIVLEDRCYVIAHDHFLAWVGAETTALETQSWRSGGIYRWPRLSRAMADFLNRQHQGQRETAPADVDC
jgi:hypothetical protein